MPYYTPYDDFTRKAALSLHLDPTLLARVVLCLEGKCACHQGAPYALEDCVRKLLEINYGRAVDELKDFCDSFSDDRQHTLPAVDVLLQDIAQPHLLDAQKWQDKHALEFKEASGESSNYVRNILSVSYPEIAIRINHLESEALVREFFSELGKLEQTHPYRSIQYFVDAVRPRFENVAHSVEQAIKAIV
jgi:hypothetical protein